MRASFEYKVTEFFSARGSFAGKTWFTVKKKASLLLFFYELLIIFALASLSDRYVVAGLAVILTITHKLSKT